MVSTDLIRLPEYLPFRDKTETADVVGYKSPGAVGGGIKFVTSGEKPCDAIEDFTHVGLVVRIEELNTVFIIEATAEGVQPHLLSYSLAQHRNVEVALFKPYVPLTRNQRNAVARAAMKYIHRPYGTSQLGIIALEKAFPSLGGKFSDDARSLICTEVTNRAYHEGIKWYLDETTKEMGKSSPNRVLYGPKLKDSRFRFTWREPAPFNALQPESVL